MAIAFGLALSMWGLTAYTVEIMFQPVVPVYTVLLIVSWILSLLYIMLFRQAFIAGIFTATLAMCYLLITPALFDTNEWYLFERGLYDFTYVVFYIIGIAFIYFAYKSYKELLAKAQ
jgi:hypothetical protein